MLSSAGGKGKRIHKSLCLSGCLVSRGDVEETNHSTGQQVVTETKPGTASIKSQGFNWPQSRTLQSLYGGSSSNDSHLKGCLWMNCLAIVRHTIIAVIPAIENFYYAQGGVAHEFYVHIWPEGTSGTYYGGAWITAIMVVAV